MGFKRFSRAKSHFLRRFAAGFLGGALATFFFGGGLVSTAHADDPSCGLSQEEEQVVELTNQKRQQEGLAPLTVDCRLVEAARAHSRVMAQRGELGHQLQGQRPLCDADARDRYDEAGYAWRACAENVASGQRSASEVVDGWMQSRGHRENILREGVEHIGVGRATAPDGRAYWTQTFGALRPGAS